MAIGKSTGEKSEVLALARRAAARLRKDATTATRRLRLCEELLDADTASEELRELAAALGALDTDACHYWIGTFYTLLLSAADRRSQAAYFTPPHLARGVIGLAQKEGFDLRTHTVVDPAAGGAAFLSMVAGHMRAARSTGANIAKRLAGMEIDSGLARLAERLIAERLSIEVRTGEIVKHRDSLTIRSPQQFDLVIANPPYGRVLDAPSSRHWAQVCHAGHINKFALFAELCFRLAKPGGLVALVLPSSFVAGPLYDKLRGHIRRNGEVLTLASVTDREDVFLDVQQDITVLLVRAGAEHSIARQVTFGEFSGRRPFKVRSTGCLPEHAGAAWGVPTSAAGQAVGGAVLADYGADVRAGYFVWNREQHRMRPRSYSGRDVPLIWAENIRAGALCKPLSRDRDGVDYVNFKEGASERPVVRKNAVVIQRTTNSSQPRRLIAARVSPSVVKEFGGFVSENHTIVLTARNDKALNALCLLLNSRAADARYRRLSGTASVSVKLLRSLDLPRPEVLYQALERFDDPEAAVEHAYALSAIATTEAAA